MLFSRLATMSTICSDMSPVMLTSVVGGNMGRISAMTARTPWSSVPLAAQSRDEPDPYSRPARMTSDVPASA